MSSTSDNRVAKQLGTLLGSVWRAIALGQVLLKVKCKEILGCIVSKYTIQYRAVFVLHIVGPDLEGDYPDEPSAQSAEHTSPAKHPDASSAAYILNYLYLSSIRRL